MPVRLCFPEIKKVTLESFDLPAMAADAVTLRARCSLMSTGTENIVFNHLIEPGSYWKGWAQYPFYPGYALVAEVIAAGPDVTTLQVGDRVVTRAGHGSHTVKPAAQCVKVPDAVTDDQAAWFALAKIAAMTLPVGDFGVGRSVAVIGAGPVGQMLTRWAVQAGCDPVVVIDPAAPRLPLALAGGATHTLAVGVGDAGDPLRAICGGRLPDMVVDTTGHHAVFPLALNLVRDHGQMVLLGDCATPTKQHMSMDFLRRGLRLVGVHDCHETPDWDTAKIVSLYFRAIERGRLHVDGLITHRFAPSACVEAYALPNQRRSDTMGILFDWTGATEG